MIETTVESLFGTNAGIVWKALNQNGTSNIGDLVKATSLSQEEVYGALGWLGREDKIVMEQRGRALLFSLRDAEISRAAIKGATTEGPIPQEQIHVIKSMPPKVAIDASKTKTKTLIFETVKNALAFIKSELEANREPAVDQVSKAVGMDNRQLGKVLSRLDIKSKPVNRGGKCFRIYPIGSKARACDLAALDAEELQKIIDAKVKTTE